MFFTLRMCFFKVKHYFGHILGMVGPIDVKRKGSELVVHWVQYVTLTCDLTHYLNLHENNFTHIDDFRTLFKGLIDLRRNPWHCGEDLYWMGEEEMRFERGLTCASPPCLHGMAIADMSKWILSPIARFMGPTWGPPGADRTKVGPMLATRTLLSGKCTLFTVFFALFWSCSCWYYPGWINVVGGNNPGTYDDVIKWKHFPYYWPFVKEIHRSSLEFENGYVMSFRTF